MKDPAFNFYSDNFLSGTMFFTDEQVGKYIRLLCAQHLTGHLEEKHMIFICKGHDEDIWKKFKKDGEGKFYNERLDLEIQKRKSYSESRRKNKLGKTHHKDNKNISSSYDSSHDDDMGNGIENNINVLEGGMGETVPITWKQSFEVYQVELREAYRRIVTPEYIKERETYHPNLNVRLSLEKACKDYWATEAGWQYKKRSRIKTINWETTFNNSLTLKQNQVWKPMDKKPQEQPGQIKLNKTLA